MKGLNVSGMLGHLESVGGILQLALTVWMVVDAVQNRADPYWFWVIVILQPFGSWIYFFMFKANDFDLFRLPSMRRGPSLDQLRYNLRENPCVANRILLADRLRDHGDLDEARSLYQQVLKLDDADKSALHGMGRALLKAGQPAEAVESLRQVISLDKSYRDYAPWVDLAEALWTNGQKGEAIAHLEKLVALHPRFNYLTALAGYLQQVGRRDEARTMVSRALDDFKHSPTFIKRTQRRWARDARALLKTLSA